MVLPSDPTAVAGGRRSPLPSVPSVVVGGTSSPTRASQSPVTRAASSLPQLNVLQTATEMFKNPETPLYQKIFLAFLLGLSAISAFITTVYTINRAYMPADATLEQKLLIVLNKIAELQFFGNNTNTTI